MLLDRVAAGYNNSSVGRALCYVVGLDNFPRQPRCSSPSFIHFVPASFRQAAFFRPSRSRGTYADRP